MVKLGEGEGTRRSKQIRSIDFETWIKLHGGRGALKRLQWDHSEGGSWPRFDQIHASKPKKQKTFVRRMKKKMKNINYFALIHIFTCGCQDRIRFSQP